MRQRVLEHIIKRYPNRRLYDTQMSMYVTLADIKQMVLEHEVFSIVDAKSGEDLTRSMLHQIILEEESGGVPLFSADTLAQIIRSYGSVSQGMLGSYLEKNMQAFADMQKLLGQENLSETEQTIDQAMWQQLLAMQGPMMHGLMSNYIEQSRHMFEQMRTIMATQTAALLQTLSEQGLGSPEQLADSLQQWTQQQQSVSHALLPKKSSDTSNEI